MKLLKEAEAKFNKLVDSIEDWKTRDDSQEAMKKIKKLSRSYKHNIVGDACTGDEVCFVKAHWDSITVGSGKYKRNINVISEYELIEGKIIKDSYGKAKQQHTFTIQLKDKSKMLIKGRNLYRLGVWRKDWKIEEDRQEALDEKHGRGGAARNERSVMKENRFNRSHGFNEYGADYEFEDEDF